MDLILLYACLQFENEIMNRNPLAPKLLRRGEKKPHKRRSSVDDGSKVVLPGNREHGVSANLLTPVF